MSKFRYPTQMGATAWSAFSGVFLLLTAAFQISGCAYGTESDLPHSPTYGRHFPQGTAAVDYIYGPDGMWRNVSHLEYKWNFYSHEGKGPPAHPVDKYKLLRYANGSHHTTALDVNGHLLGDLDHDQEIDSPALGGAFFEHNGRGPRGVATQPPFTHFWFDDNLLASYMSAAYGRETPQGLSHYPDFIRWQILGLDATHWKPYREKFFDTIALNVLFHLAVHDVDAALKEWKELLRAANVFYNRTTRRFEYPAIRENYHLALFKIATETLLLEELPDDLRADLIQHALALKSLLLDEQESDGESYLGWRTDRFNRLSVMNTETISACVLALGTGALLNFEPGLDPLKTDFSKFRLRSDHSLSAITSRRKPGRELMVSGPGWQLPPGSYKAALYFRAPHPKKASTLAATVEVWDAVERLNAIEVFDSSLLGQNKWTEVTVPFSIDTQDQKFEIRVFWEGQVDLDLASVQIKFEANIQ